MSDLDLPDLASLPTAPPPPPAEYIDDDRRTVRPPRPQRAGTALWKVVALILAVQAALVSSALLVAVERPSVTVSVVALVLTNVFITVVLARSR